MGYIRYRTPHSWLFPDLRGGLSGEADLDAHMSDLAEYFPCIVGKPGVRPWDPERLDEWADQAGTTASELYTARFVLHVWDGTQRWKCGRFDLLEALEFWDELHREAFVSWILDPWWPTSLHIARDPLDEPSRDGPLPDLDRLTPFVPE
jgi:hypothetical protein